MVIIDMFNTFGFSSWR